MLGKGDPLNWGTMGSKSCPSAPRPCSHTTAAVGSGPPLDAACCYFSARDKDVLQPAQKAFITWDPEARKESFTVQPKFEGDAEDLRGSRAMHAEGSAQLVDGFESFVDG